MSNKNLNYNNFLAKLGFEEFNEMQLDFFTKADKNQNLILLAPTGSGKTLAFLLPLISSLEENTKNVQALVIVPTRELALQIEQVLKSLKTNFKSTLCYGGHSMRTEQNSLAEGATIVIGTPGRLADHIQRGSLELLEVKTVVLDEFDKSLELGFHDQIASIFKSISGSPKHFLTSATALKKWPDFLPFEYPQEINYLENTIKSNLELKVLYTSHKEKGENLLRLLSKFDQESSIVFCNHREAVDRLSILMKDYDFEHAVLHGGMDQLDREKNLIKFRSGTVNILVATDLASRGLDIPEIKHVIHYQLPHKEEAFVHRNGRTARMHAEGISYLVIADDEYIPEYIEQEIQEVSVEEDFSAPAPSEYACIYFSAGKKDKISKGDLVGLLTKKGGLEGKDIGLITILDTSSYAAVNRIQLKRVIEKLHNEKLKKVKVKVEEAN
jgi:superfamily II DNA/RNA helicase